MNKMKLLFSAVAVGAVSVSILAQAYSQNPPKRESAFACDRLVLTPEARKRHFDELGPALRAITKGTRELSDGYEFEFPSDSASFKLVSEWAAGEHLCCPFFDIDLRLEREGGAFWLRLTGREGVKQFIRQDFAPLFETQAGKPATRTDRQGLDVWVGKIEELVVPAAQAMPEAKYSFAPSTGEFKGVRTFAEQVKHLSAANYQLGAPLLGEKPPAGTHDETAPDSVRSRTEILAYLQGSFALLHRAAATIREDRLNDTVTFNGKSYTRAYLMIDALIHSANHYGQMVEYLRLNGIVPPASR